VIIKGTIANRVQLSFLTEMLTNLQSDMIMLEMSLPNRAGILTPVDGLEEGETVTMLVMPVMLNS
jgi:DNA polymerase-3 subunit beta